MSTDDGSTQTALPTQAAVPARTLATLALGAAARYTGTAMRYPQDGGWWRTSYPQLGADVRVIAKGLIALGVAPGDRVALLSRTRYEWTLLD